MLKSWTRATALAIQARAGVSFALLAWATIVILASLTTFVFLCVSLYNWLAWQLGDVFAGLATAGVFVLFAAIGIVSAMLARRRAKRRAIVERAARAPSLLLDPKVLAAVVQAGRTVGWQRLVPIALLGFMAAHWLREHREHGGDEAG
jgi:hypothetical protein